MSVTDATGRGSVRRLRKTLERALRRSSEFKLSSLKKWARAGRRRRIPRRRWLSRRAIRSIGRAIGLDVVLTARLVRRQSRQRRRYRLLISARSVRTGRQMIRRSVELKRPSISPADARHGFSMLSWGLTVAAAPRPDLAATDDARHPPRSQDAAAPSPSSDDGRPATAATAPSSAEREGTQQDLRSDPQPTAAEPAQRSESADATDWAAADQGWDPVTSAAAPAENASATVGALGDLSVKLGGRVTVEHFSYFKELGDDKVGGRNSVDFALEAEAKARHVLALGRFLVRHDFSNDRRDRFEAEEAYVEAELGPVTVRAGRVIVSWGTANLVNPTDIVNPIDLRDPLDPERRGTWMIRAGLLLGAVLIEGYYLPVPEQHLLPLPDGYTEQGVPIGPWRWMGAGLPVPPGSPPLRVNLDWGAPPSTSLPNTQIGARISTAFAGVDVALSYLWRFDLLPTFRATQTPDDPVSPTVIDVQATSEFHRVHMIAAEGEGTIGKVRLAAEALLVLTEDMAGTDDAILNPFLSAVAGLDYRSGALFGDHHIHLFLDFWITRSLVGELPEGSVARALYPLDYAAFGRTRYEAGESLRLDFNILSSLSSYDLVLNPSVEWVLFDRLTLQLGAMFLLGSADSGFFGPAGDNSRLELSAEMAF